MISVHSNKSIKQVGDIMSNCSIKATLLLLFASLLVTSIHGTHLTDSDIINSSCSTTLYPDICYSTISTTENLTTNKDVIQVAIDKTKEIIQGNLNTIKELTASTNLTKRGKLALHDCLQMVTGTLEDLDMVTQDLKVYPAKKSIEQHANDLKTLMSTAITNKEACLDGLSYDEPCKRLRESIIEGQDLGGKMCSNVLGMITTMTDIDMANEAAKSNVRKLKEKKKSMILPEWLSKRDRRMLLAPFDSPDVIVSKNGKGKYTTVAAAVQAAPVKSRNRYVIKILAGVYRENVEIPKNKTNIMFLGEGLNVTIITGKKSVGTGSTTFNSATVGALGEGFMARDITFQNTAGASGHQAVALRVNGDYSAFYRCGMIGYQDTLYVFSSRQFYVKCAIAGTVDFIFGNAAVVFQYCEILIRKPDPHQSNMVTAQGRTDPQQNTGIVIQNCKIEATPNFKPVKAQFKSYLGRPWKNHSRTVIMKTTISDVIDPAGWSPWEGDFALNTLYYREYRNVGPGANTSKRVKWKGYRVMLTDIEAMPYTAGMFITGLNWLPWTGFPYWAGL